jgi:hypothetical protein
MVDRSKSQHQPFTNHVGLLVGLKPFAQCHYTFLIRFAGVAVIGEI